MSAKDTVVGTAKQIVAEILGDGGLAREGARQIAGDIPHEAAPQQLPPHQPAVQPPIIPSHLESSHMDENRFASLLGHAAVKVWADLPRDAQERLFAAAVDDGVIANSLAQFLHDHHPKTAHPPRPTQLA